LGHRICCDDRDGFSRRDYGGRGLKTVAPRILHAPNALTENAPLPI
jgi:hypothetical protein